MRVLMPSISLNQIQYVLALHKTGSFTEAATRCMITQSTLSTMVRKLEDQINMQIFDRSAKPLKLTKEGERLINQFTLINNEYGNLLELIQQTNKEYFGTLKIGIIPTLAPFLLPLILPKLIQKHPKVEFRIFEITTHDIVHKLKLKELDIGVLSLPVHIDGLIEKSLFKEDFLIYDTRGTHHKKFKYTIQDIDVSRLWLLEESHCLSSQIGRICHLKNQESYMSNLTFSSGSILSLLELVHINKGITLLPRLATLQKHVVNPNYIYPLKNPVPVRDIGLLTHKNFLKTSMQAMLEKEIKLAVNPLLKKSVKYKVIAPFK